MAAVVSYTRSYSSLGVSVRRLYGTTIIEVLAFSRVWWVKYVEKFGNGTLVVFPSFGEVQLKLIAIKRRV